MPILVTPLLILTVSIASLILYQGILEGMYQSVIFPLPEMVSSPVDSLKVQVRPSPQFPEVSAARTGDAIYGSRATTSTRASNRLSQFLAFLIFVSSYCKGFLQSVSAGTHPRMRPLAAVPGQIERRIRSAYANLLMPL